MTLRELLYSYLHLFCIQHFEDILSSCLTYLNILIVLPFLLPIYYLDTSLPYWEWELDGDDQKGSAPLEASTFGSVNGLNQSDCEVPPNLNVAPLCVVTEGIAACSIWPTRFGCVRRSFSTRADIPSFTSQVEIIDQIINNVNYTNIPRDRTTTDFGRFLEGAPHAIPHIWLSGFMLREDSAAYDPLFWIHHCNVDRIFALWQDYHNYEVVAPGDIQPMVQGPTNLDEPQFFNGLDGSQSPFFFLPGGGDYPSPRQVLLNNDLLKVTYVEDSLAQALVDVTTDDQDRTNNYTPNPAYFTLPAQAIPDEDEPVWDDPAREQIWQDLMADGLSAEEAINQLAIEECGPDNPIIVPQWWIEQSGMDEKFFRCHVE